MFLILIYFILVLLLFWEKNEKTIGIISLFLLFLLFSFSNNIADRSNYEFVLLYDSFGSVEPLWSLFLFIAKKMNLTIQSLYFVVGTIYLTTLYFITMKLSQNNNRILACYMVGMFFLDVVQLRFTLSCVFLLWAFYLYFTEVNNKRACIKFSIFILLATLVHASNIVLLIYNFAKTQTKKNIYIVTLASFFICFFMLRFLTIWFGSLFDVQSKVDRIFSTESHLSSLSTVSNGVYLLVLLLIAALMVYNTNSIQKNESIIYTQNISILSLSLFPLSFFISDFRRHVFLITLITVTLFYRNESKYKDALLSIVPLLLFCCFFIYSTFLGNRYSVFFPIFEENIFIKYIMDLF